MRPVEGSKSLPVASFTSSSSTSEAGKLMSCALSVATRSDHWPLRNAMRSAFALDDQAHRDALHPSGRSRAPADLAPEHRRHLVADEPVEHPASFLRLDELHVEVARFRERGLDRAAGDLVEDHPLHGHLRLQHLEHVPRDGLALAILVGREDELVGVLQRPLQIGDDLLLPVGRRRTRARSGCRRRSRDPSGEGRGCGRCSPSRRSPRRGSPRWSSPSPVTPR